MALAMTIGSDANRSAIFEIASYFSTAVLYGELANVSRFATAVASKFVRITPGSMSETSTLNGRSS